MTENLMNSPTAWLVLSFLTVFSTFFGVFSWMIGRKRKQFSVSCRTNEIIIAGKTQIEKLKIQYDGKTIENLSASKFYIWNSGNTVINTSDIVDSRPLCVKNTGSASILDVRILKVCEETNGFIISEVSKDIAKLSFDYVDSDEGLVLQILHDGESLDLELDCKIKGGKTIRDCSPIKRKNMNKTDNIMGFINAILPITLGLAIAVPFYKLAIFVQSLINTSSFWGKMLASAIVILGFLGGIYLGAKIPAIISRRLHREIPKKLG